jgi:hypothetical protein
MSTCPVVTLSVLRPLVQDGGSRRAWGQRGGRPSAGRGDLWEVTEGRGQFAGAAGLITSNFTVGSKGEVVDNHYVRLFLPA